ncbi:MAG: LytTR family transcriptional regulator DNA-binding domain-containing protein [Oscillospiraceae bacterium]|nr:LytTR family transcriptional regulator DNA-binding domain-containing protein [Oscillospiraceae bacterium]
MQLTWDNIQANAVAFSKRWKDGRNEEAEAQAFEIDFLHVFGVDDPVKLGDFEYKVPLSGNKTGYIDYLWKGRIAIEMKSRGKDLAAAFEQLRAYMSHLPEDDIPDLWMVCDFENIRLCRRSTNEVYNFKTKDLRKHIKRFANIAGYAAERVRDDQVEVSVKAAEKMARLHDALKENGYGGHELEVYLVRLLFCLFADDTGIFPQDSLFSYIENSKQDGSDLSERISKLFEVLNKAAERLKKTEQFLLVQTSETTVKIPFDDILCIESFAHYIVIQTKTASIETRANIGEIEKAVGDRFVRCHRSYIVGLNHISRITKTDVILDNGKSIPLSRRLYTEINLAFIEYHKGRKK